MRVARRSAPVESPPLQVGIVSPPTLPAESDLEQMFRDFFRRIQPRTRAYAAKCLNPEDAKDAFAAAIAELWYRWSSLRHDQRTDEYFFGILNHKIADAQRQGGELVSLEDVEDELEQRAFAESDADSQAAKIYGLLDDAADAMPPQRRKVWHLLRQEEFTYKDVAATMRVSEATVNRHLSLGNADVRATFAREGYRLAEGVRPLLKNPEAGDPAGDPSND